MGIIHRERDHLSLWKRELGLGVGERELGVGESFGLGGGLREVWVFG